MRKALIPTGLSSLFLCAQSAAVGIREKQGYSGQFRSSKLLTTQELGTPGNPVKYFEGLAGTISRRSKSNQFVLADFVTTSAVTQNRPMVVT